jgi:hypothetical protein
LRKRQVGDQNKHVGNPHTNEIIRIHTDRPNKTICVVEDATIARETVAPLPLPFINTGLIYSIIPFLVFSSLFGSIINPVFESRAPPNIPNDPEYVNVTISIYIPHNI